MTRHYWTADGRHWVLMEIDEDGVPVSFKWEFFQWLGSLLDNVTRR